MAKKTPSLSLIHGEPLADLMDAPADLGKTGARLWRSIQQQYGISDNGGLCLLKLACESADRAQRCREIIDSEGEVVRHRGAVKDHPLLRHELAARSFTVRTLLRLGLDVEPVGRPGRPARQLGG